MAVKSSFILQFMKTFAWNSHWFCLKYLVAFTSEVNWSQCLPHGNFQWFFSCVFQRTWHWHMYVCTWMCSPLLKDISSVRFSRSVVSDPATPWTAACQASLSITNSQSLPKLTSIELVMPSSHLIFCRPLLLLPSIFPSIKDFSNGSALYIRWPKYWSFSFNISPPNDYSGLISFEMDLWDLLAAQGTCKSLLQHHSSKASILLCSAFLIVQLSHPCMTTWKTIALTRWTFVGKAF